MVQVLPFCWRSAISLTTTYSCALWASSRLAWDGALDQHCLCHFPCEIRVGALASLCVFSTVAVSIYTTLWIPQISTVKVWSSTQLTIYRLSVFEANFLCGSFAAAWLLAFELNVAVPHTLNT